MPLSWCRTATWRQRTLEGACHPALGNLGQNLSPASADALEDDADAMWLGGRGQGHNDSPLKTVAWDTHCIASILAGRTHPRTLTQSFALQPTRNIVK